MCNIKTCQIFSRNYRDRNDEKNRLSDIKNIDDSVCCQIFDKMHCHYSHSFDIGRRLLSTDKVNTLNNQLISQTNSMLCNQSKNIKNTGFHRRYQCIKNYHYGFVFRYGYQWEKRFGIPLGCGKHRKKTLFLHKLKPKHSSLKEELTQNMVSTISLQQFNIEYGKAQKFFDSKFCKHAFPSQLERRNINQKKCQKIWEFKLEYILSLMIYCNYTNLSYEFSLSYRDDNGTKHENFYWMGMYAKISVQRFGVSKNDLIVYHGVSNKFIFEFGFDTRTFAFHAFGPLSTSTQFEVALQFAGDTGLILELNPGTSKSFSCAWLSDFGNESEHLFLQTIRKGDRMQINNILDTQMGFEYNSLMNALETVTNKCFKNSWKKKQFDIPLKTQFLIYSVTTCQLSQKIQSRKNVHCKSKYMHQLVTSYFNQQKRGEISLKRIKDPNYSFIYDIFQKTKCGLIKWQEYDALFPELEHLEIRYVNLDDSLLDYIYKCIQKSKIKFLYVNPLSHSALSVEKAVSKNKKRFNEIHFNIKPDMNYTHVLSIWKMYNFR
eukprot:77747_1